MKRNYITPEIEVFGFAPEKGFAQSPVALGEGATYDMATEAEGGWETL